MTDEPIPPPPADAPSPEPQPDPQTMPDPPIPTDGKPPVDLAAFAKYFSDGAFWQKVKDFAGKIGRGTLTKALELYNVAMSKDTPVIAKAIALGSLGYLILPLDAIPDFVPGAGLADDAMALAAAAAAIFKSITPAVKMQAYTQVSKWFGPDKNAPAADVPAPTTSPEAETPLTEGMPPPS